VRRFAAFLTELTPDELRRRYDAARMTKLEIYPYDDWTRESGDGDSPIEWLLDCFAEVRTFVSKAAAVGELSSTFPDHERRARARLPYAATPSRSRS
jgi:hypothetical protein